MTTVAPKNIKAVNTVKDSSGKLNSTIHKLSDQLVSLNTEKNIIPRNQLIKVEMWIKYQSHIR